MNDFLKETFRPYTEEERRALHRHYRRNAVVRLLAIGIVLVAAAAVLLPMVFTRTQLSGTWIAVHEHADGFQPEDTVLEFKDGSFYRNGKDYGSPVRKDGSTVITVYTPAGQYDKYVSVKDHVLTIEYTLPKTNSVYTGSQPSLPDENMGLTYATLSAVQQNQEASENDRHVVEMYVRISDQCSLTEEERAALY